jgi:hypothetical protein
MSSCCGGGSTAASACAVSLCPVSGTKGKAVEALTVKAILREPALRRFVDSALYFCPDATCEIVYFDAEGSLYRRDDVRVRVWQKEPFGDRTVCYCFGEDEHGIRTEIHTNGASSAVERVRAHIAAGRCACEVRNPRGVCCLGDVTAAIKRVASAVQVEASSAGM